MITGFPGESETQFKNLLDFVKFVGFDRLGAFAYSQEESTPAAKRKDQVPEDVREKRCEELMQLQQTISLERQQRWRGQFLKVLIEEKLPDGRFLGRSEGDAPEIDGSVYVNSSAELIIGEFAQVKIQDVDSYDLMGEVVS